MISLNYCSSDSYFLSKKMNLQQIASTFKHIIMISKIILKYAFGNVDKVNANYIAKHVAFSKK